LLEKRVRHPPARISATITIHSLKIPPEPIQKDKDPPLACAQVEENVLDLPPLLDDLSFLLID
jgi:hypothetical protein